MNRILFIIDGFNVYHVLEGEKKCPQAGAYRKYKWLNLAKLCKCFTKATDTIVDIYYCTALATWNIEKLKRHQTYIKALESVKVKLLYGQFKNRTKFCRLCRREYTVPEEKQTDVNIATTLIREAIADTYDTAIIISGDSDLVPAINAVKSIFPTKRIGIIIPITRHAESLKQAVDFHHKMKERHLSTSQFDETIDLGGGVLLKRPDTWI